MTLPISASTPVYPTSTTNQAQTATPVAKTEATQTTTPTQTSTATKPISQTPQVDTAPQSQQVAADTAQALSAPVNQTRAAEVSVILHGGSFEALSEEDQKIVPEMEKQTRVKYLSADVMVNAIDSQVRLNPEQAKQLKTFFAQFSRDELRQLTQAQTHSSKATGAGNGATGSSEGGHYVNSPMTSIIQLARENRLDSETLGALTELVSDEGSSKLDPSLKPHKAALAASALQDIAFPQSINQHSVGSCAATSVQTHLAVTSPKQYLQTLTDLVRPDSEQASTEIRALAGSISDDNSGRSLSGRIMQNALLDSANGEEVYVRGGINSSEQLKLMKELYPEGDYQNRSLLKAPISTPDELVTIAEESTAAGFPVVSNVAWPNTFDHSIMVTKVDRENNRVYYFNPQGNQSLEGVNQKQSNHGLQWMSLDDYKALLQDVQIPNKTTEPPQLNAAFGQFENYQHKDFGPNISINQNAQAKKEILVNTLRQLPEALQGNADVQNVLSLAINEASKNKADFGRAHFDDLINTLKKVGEHPQGLNIIRHFSAAENINQASGQKPIKGFDYSNALHYAMEIANSPEYSSLSDAQATQTFLAVRLSPSDSLDDPALRKEYVQNPMQFVTQAPEAARNKILFELGKAAGEKGDWKTWSQAKANQTPNNSNGLNAAVTGEWYGLSPNKRSQFEQAFLSSLSPAQIQQMHTELSAKAAPGSEGPTGQFLQMLETLRPELKAGRP